MKHWEESWKFLTNFEVLHLVNAVSNAWYYFSNKVILEGEIKDVKKAVFHLISNTR